MSHAENSRFVEFSAERLFKLFYVYYQHVRTSIRITQEVNIASYIHRLKREEEVRPPDLR